MRLHQSFRFLAACSLVVIPTLNEVGSLAYLTIKLVVD